MQNSIEIGSGWRNRFLNLQKSLSTVVYFSLFLSSFLSLLEACSKRSDSGERRELGEESGKTREDWGEGAPRCPSIFLASF